MVKHALYIQAIERLMNTLPKPDIINLAMVLDHNPNRCSECQTLLASPDPLAPEERAFHERFLAYSDDQYTLLEAPPDDTIEMVEWRLSRRLFEHDTLQAIKTSREVIDLPADQ